MTHDTRPSGVDLTALLARIHGNQAALGQIVQLMLDHLPARVQAVRHAYDERDMAGLATASHALRGSLANFTTGPAWSLAGEVERSARDGKLDRVAEGLAALLPAVAVVEAELRSWLDEVQP